MKFDNDYWHSLDRQYIEKLDVSAKNVGLSTPPMKDQLEGLKTRIFQGASQIELGFMGKAKGSMGQGAPTPEMYGREEREAMRQLARLNEVETSTHTSPNVQGFAGLGERGFSEEVREQNLIEIKRTIDFAADVAGGGPVVLHTGEFPRAVSKFKKEGFEAYPGEEKKQIHYLVNEKTGEIRRGVREDEEIWIPKYKYKDGKPVILEDEYGNQKKIKLFDKEVPIYEYELDKQGNIEVEKKVFSDYKKQFKDREGRIDEAKAAKAFYEEQLKAEQLQALGQADEYENHYKSALEEREKIIKSLKFYERLTRVPGIDQEKLKETLRTSVPFVPPEEVEPVSFLRERLRETEKRMNYGQETATAGRKNAARIQDEIAHTKPIEEYGVEKSAETLARAGIYALQKEKEIHRLKGEKEQPLFIAPENIFPENGYASHPQELKELILKSRENMTGILWKGDRPTKEGTRLGVYSKEAAEKAAADHIKATFDIGHLNTWRKYFQGDEKGFHKWIKEQVDDLNQKKIIGHIHLSDNFGYYDEHVDPGEGNVPIPEFIKQMKESGYKGKIIVEPAHQDVRAWTKFMSNFASPVYRTKLWTEDDLGFFKGTTYSPTYIVGGYAPDSGGEETDWRLWSGIRLE